MDDTTSRADRAALDAAEHAARQERFDRDVRTPRADRAKRWRVPAAAAGMALVVGAMGGFGIGALSSPDAATTVVVSAAP